MKSISFLTLLLTMFFLGAVSAEAANHYVRAGASGSANGADWTNAYTSLPASLVRGDTYYVADGTYACRTFNTPVSGTSRITIKKATNADHGTSTGWLDTYGDGQAFWTSSGNGCLAFNTSYWVFSGNQGSGKSNMGFVLRVATWNGANANLITVAYGGSSQTDININHTEGSMHVYGGGDTDWNSIIYAGAGLTNSNISYNYWHDTNWFAMLLGVDWSNVTIEHNYFENAYRKELLSCKSCDNLIWRWNIAHNTAGTGYLVAMPAGAPSNWFIYGNIFFNTDPTYSTQDCIFCTNLGHGQSSNNIFIYNNTFINHYGSAIIKFENCTPNCLAKNNLFYGSTPSGGWGVSSTHDYSWCNPSGSCSGIASEANDQAGAGDPFVNVAGEDFRLSAATAAGETLASPYNVDMNGVTRGADGIWDRGALEFVSGGANPPPAAPTNVQVQ